MTRTWVNRKVLLSGLPEAPGSRRQGGGGGGLRSLNGKWGKVVTYFCRDDTPCTPGTVLGATWPNAFGFAVELDDPTVVEDLVEESGGSGGRGESSGQPVVVLVLKENIQLLTDDNATEEERALTARNNAKTIKKFEAEERGRLDRARDEKKYKGRRRQTKRRGQTEGTCPCCDKPMDLCEEVEIELIAGPEGAIEMLKTSVRTQEQAAEAIVDFVNMVMYEVSSGYGAIKGCMCDNWSNALLRMRSHEPPAAMWHQREHEHGSGCEPMCEHFGNNPLQHPLPAMLGAGLGDAALNIAWRDEGGTRFAAVRLFMAFLVTQPPPMYIYSYDTHNVFQQLYSTLAAGTDEFAQVCGWGVCCCNFLLILVAPSVSCSCLDAPYTRSSKLPPSPAVSYCFPMSTTRLSYTSFTSQPPSSGCSPSSRHCLRKRLIVEAR